MSFKEYTGDFMGMYNNENHLVFRWDGDCKILFSVCRQGNAAVCNFASDKRGLRKLRTASNEFINFVFNNFEWCDMIIAESKINSAKKLNEKLGFEFLASFDDDPHDAYYLTKEKYYG